jgi:hypothetical protein
MIETKKIDINGRTYMIRQLGGSWKQRLKIWQAKTQVQLRKIRPDLEIPKKESKEWKEFIESDDYLSLALEIAASQTEEDIKNTKSLIQAAVTAPKHFKSIKEEECNGLEDGYEAYFSTFPDDIHPLSDAIIKHNIGDAEKKTDDTENSNQKEADQN